MDTISIIIIAVVVFGILYLTVGKKKSSNKTVVSDKPTTLEPGTPPPGTYGGQVQTTKKAPAKPKAKAPKAKLPGDAQLQKNTKGQLEELGRKHGIDLDKRKTKAKMIAALKSEFKKK